MCCPSISYPAQGSLQTPLLDTTLCKVKNIQRCLFDGQYKFRGTSRHFFNQPAVVKKLRISYAIPKEGVLTTVRWSNDGSSLLSCGDQVTLLSYPDYQTHLSATLGASIWDATFLGRDKIAIGSGVGLAAVVPLLPQHSSTFHNIPQHSSPVAHDISTLRGANMVRCHRGSIFSVKALPGISNDLFFTSSADNTVRLHDTRTLCTCGPATTCNNHVIFRGNSSLTSLSVNPANAYQFCVSHGILIGIHDLRMCCSDTSHFLDKYDIPPPSRRHGNHAQNRVTDTLYNQTGTEILVNTRTVGLLLISTQDHSQIRNLRGISEESATHNTSPCRRGNTSLCRHDNIRCYNDTCLSDITPCHNDYISCYHGSIPCHHDNKEKYIVCEDFSGTGSVRLTEPRGAAGQLGRDLTSWLKTSCGGGEEEACKRCGAKYGGDGSRTDGIVAGCSGLRSGGIVARYTGHRNRRTVLKEAAFWGDHFILSGSDCGRLFVWDKNSGEVVAALNADSQITLSIEPHPYHPVVACCGLDGSLNVLEPLLGADPSEEADIESIVSENRRILEEEEYVIPIPNSLVMRALSGVDPGDMLAAIL